MSALRIAQRYSKSLIDLAKEQGKLDVVTSNIRHFQTSVQNRDLAMLLKSPIVSASKKQNVLDALFGDYDELTRKFLGLVLLKKREAALPQIADEYISQYKKLQGISTVKITSAAPLSQDTIDAIQAKLVSLGVATKRVELEKAIDESLIGGFILEIGDRLYDASTLAQLNKLKREFA